MPEFVQIGNEIDNGLLWPVGKIWKPDAESPDWDSAATLFKAASRGVRRATPDGGRMRIVLHTATGGHVEKTARFHTEMQQRGIDYDVAGLSYYPWWHGTLDALRENSRQLAGSFDKEVMVVETAFPWNEGSRHQKFHQQDYPWPKTPEGQAGFLRDVITTIHALPDHKGIGVLWWHPDSIPVEATGVWMAGTCALWRPDATPLPALRQFQSH